MGNNRLTKWHYSTYNCFFIRDLLVALSFKKELTGGGFVDEIVTECGVGLGHMKWLTQDCDHTFVVESDWNIVCLSFDRPLLIHVL